MRFSTNEHGYASLEAFVPMGLQEAFEVYEWPGLPHVVVSDYGGGVAWEGRLEDITIVPGGVQLAAFGYQNALRDVTYTALWSRSGSRILASPADFAAPALASSGRSANNPSRPISTSVSESLTKGITMAILRQSKLPTAAKIHIL